MPRLIALGPESGRLWQRELLWKKLLILEQLRNSEQEQEAGPSSSNGLVLGATPSLHSLGNLLSSLDKQAKTAGKLNMLLRSCVLVYGHTCTCVQELVCGYALYHCTENTIF